MTCGQLMGRRVLVTRAAEDAEVWAARLASLGAQPVVLACLVSVPIDDTATGPALSAALADAAWLLVSSRHGVAVVAQLIGGVLPPRVLIAAVGSATAAAARRLLGRVDLIADENTSRGLGDASRRQLRGSVVGARIVVAGAAGGRTEAASVLTAAGATVVTIPVYRTIPVSPRTKRDLGADGVDDILLASPSAVRGLINGAVLPPSARIVTIGPTTTAAAVAAGLTVDVESPRPDFEGMLEAIA